jgi:hypothetical protein
MMRSIVPFQLPNGRDTFLAWTMKFYSKIQIMWRHYWIWEFVLVFLVIVGFFSSKFLLSITIIMKHFHHWAKWHFFKVHVIPIMLLNYIISAYTNEILYYILYECDCKFIDCLCTVYQNDHIDEKKIQF